MNTNRLNGIEAIFLDDGGVMSGNGRLAPQYTTIMDDYLAARLGGEPSQWSDANAAIVVRHMAWLD
ncbi:MAG: hypothetical protein QF422_04360 [Dehalococcoidia bacterium]|jgi:hypothetical protein|nr:hypothetical protein [Dehalococcoidia bacterium]